MLVLERILAIPDQSIDYLQMGISGGERAALAARGFVRKDGTKAKDYMIRTIQKTEKNKAKAEKAIIKGDKKLPVKLSKPAKSLNQKSDQAYRLHEQTKAKVEKLKDKLSDLYDEGSKLQDRLDEAKSKVESGRTKKASSTQKNIGKFAASLQSELANGGQPVPVMRQKGNKKQIAELDDKINENFNQRIALQSQVKRLQSRASKLLDASQDYADKASQSSSAIAPDTAKKLAITDKKGFQSEGAAAKKIKGAIAGVKGGKVVKGASPRDRASFISKSLQNTLGENNFLVKNKHEGVKLIEDAIKNNRGNLEADSMGKLQVLKINKPSKKFPYGSASIVVDNSTLGKGYGRERSTVDLVYLADNARKLAKKQDSASPMERLDRLVKLGDELKPKQPSAAKKLAVTYNKKGDLSEGSAAKKIKAAIAATSATPKSRKVVKGMMPVSGRVIEFGKVGKDGFAKVTVTYPVHSTKNKSRSMQSDPQKGEKIGDYFVSGDARSGYGVTHLPSGFQVFSPRSLRDQTGNDNKESAKSTARKLHDAKISLPNTFHKMKNTEPSKYQEFGRKVLNAVNGEGASQQQPERSPNADVKSDRAKPEFTTLAKANQKNVPSAAEQRYASKASKRESSKGKAPLNLKDSLNQQVIRSTERSNRVKLQGKKVSPQRSLEATKFQVANQALTNISANTKRLRRISTGTAKKRTITDSLGNSFTRKKYRFKDKKQPSAAQKMNMTDAEYAAFKKKVKRL